MAEDKNIIRFPRTLATDTHPYVKLKVKDQQAVKEIALFMPVGLQFSDGASYTTVDLGRIGSVVNNGRGNIINQSVSVASDAFRGSIAELSSGNGSSFAAAAIAAKVPGSTSASAREVYSIGKRVVTNPYTNVAFSNSEVRSYNFTFKFMPASKDESKDVLRIIKMLRKYMYVEERDSFVLRYPPKFEITFWIPNLAKSEEEAAISGDSEAPHLPKPYDCYLTNLQEVVNPSGNAFFEDGSPAEIDLTLTFQETKSLTRRDIEELERKKIRSTNEED